MICRVSQASNSHTPKKCSPFVRLLFLCCQDTFVWRHKIWWVLGQRSFIEMAQSVCFSILTAELRTGVLDWNMLCRKLFIKATECLHKMFPLNISNKNVKQKQPKGTKKNAARSFFFGFRTIYYNFFCTHMDNLINSSRFKLFSVKNSIFDSIKNS